MSLKIENLRVSREGKEIVKGVTLEVKPGEVHALMGPNGSGKSTLASALMGHPKHQVTSGAILIDDLDVTAKSPHERARAGLFLSMQYPPEISGVAFSNFLRLAYDAIKGTRMKVLEFRDLLKARMVELQMDPNMSRRSLNEGFSGGEKKRAEILQLSILEPKYAVLDETDSGLDVDALKIVCDGINRMRGPKMGILLITHYSKMLEYIRPDFVHVLADGKIVAEGGKELAERIEKEGFDDIIKQSV
jgi:Fe-S cluster assembly ATP-binding protein